MTLCHPDELGDAGNELIIAQLPFELIINPFALFTLKLAKMAIVRPGKPDGELDIQYFCHCVVLQGI